MVDITIERRGDRYAITQDGHADGNPELCAAVSSLIFAIAGWAHNAEGVSIDTETLEPGCSRLVFTGPGCSCDSVFLLATVGFLQLQKLDNSAIRVILQGDPDFTGAKSESA